MLFIGLDDTDAVGSPGTNKLARRIVQRLTGRHSVFGVTRHQLLVDPRIPYTSKNSAAAIMLLNTVRTDRRELARQVGALTAESASRGSDPGVCVAVDVPPEVVRFGLRAKQHVLTQAEARALAQRTDLHLEGLGGSEDGVIGALAAVGLAATGDDGWFVQLGAWPDDLSGEQPADVLRERGVEQFLLDQGGEPAEPDRVDVGKRLRPSYRSGRIVLYVRPTGSGWQAVRRA